MTSFSSSPSPCKAGSLDHCQASAEGMTVVHAMRRRSVILGIAPHDVAANRGEDQAHPAIMNGRGCVEWADFVYETSLASF